VDDPQEKGSNVWPKTWEKMGKSDQRGKKQFRHSMENEDRLKLSKWGGNLNEKERGGKSQRVRGGERRRERRVKSKEEIAVLR